MLYDRKIYFFQHFAIFVIAPAVDGHASAAVEEEALPLLLYVANHDGTVQIFAVAVAENARVEAPLVPLGSPDKAQRGGLGSARYGAGRQQRAKEGAHAPAAFGRQVAADFGACLQDFALQRAYAVHVAEVGHAHPSRHRVEVVAHQVYNGVVLAGLLVVVQQQALGVGQGGIHGPLHGVGVYPVIRNPYKPFGRKTYKTAGPAKAVGGRAAQEDFLQRQVGGYLGARREVQQEGVAPLQAVPDGGKSAVVALAVGGQYAQFGTPGAVGLLRAVGQLPDAEEQLRLLQRVLHKEALVQLKIQPKQVVRAAGAGFVHHCQYICCLHHHKTRINMQPQRYIKEK